MANKATSVVVPGSVMLLRWYPTTIRAPNTGSPATTSQGSRKEVAAPQSATIANVRAPASLFSCSGWLRSRSAPMRSPMASA